MTYDVCTWLVTHMCVTCDTVMNATCTNVFASTLGCHTEGSCYNSFEIIVKKLILVPVIVDYYSYLPTLYVTYGLCVCMWHNALMRLLIFLGALQRVYICPWCVCIHVTCDRHDITLISSQQVEEEKLCKKQQQSHQWQLLERANTAASILCSSWELIYN